ncbi:MAG TPA: hypothetical protein EYP85_17240 [Armatimonadetes bacterium]|nr:hypothetical protein [Armatimonadota bacterium]
MEANFQVVGNLLLPELSKFRAAARLFTALSYRAGELKRALSGYLEVAKRGARLREEADSLLSALVGIAIQNLAWGREEPQKPKVGNRETMSQYQRDLARPFLRQLHVQGWKAGAAWVEQEGERNIRVRNLLLPSRWKIGWGIDAVFLPMADGFVWERLAEVGRFVF